MIRQMLKARKNKTSEDGFRFRGIDNTRIEALSDGVFAIATALLVISSSVPETFDELLVFLEDLVPFGVCMTLLVMIWHQHYLFFMRYGFKDAKIVAINTLLLFLILFYIYPLKFLFTLLYDMLTNALTGQFQEFNRIFTEVIQIEQAPMLMIIYGIGAAGIFLTMAWMYQIALKRRIKLSLNPIEIFDTKASMQGNVMMALIPIISVVLAIMPLAPQTAFTLAGNAYMLYPVLLIPFWNHKSAKRRMLFPDQVQ